jgi:peptide-methionine (S)-S-oxide reductase
MRVKTLFTAEFPSISWDRTVEGETVMVTSRETRSGGPRSKTHLRPLLLAAATVILGTAMVAAPAFAESARVVPAPVVDETPTQNLETAILAGGCFWGVQGVFQHVEGVTRAVSGYAGGEQATAQYERVVSGRTGHAESVEITFDPSKVSFGRILQIYFSVAHDPTELNRQGPDTGTQYRSTIFPTSAKQADVAKAYIAQLDAARIFGKTIATTIEPDRTFYRAEDYHQDYLTRHPFQPYIVINDLPKVANLKRLFPESYRAEPALVLAQSPKS